MVVKSGGMLWGPPPEGRGKDQGSIQKVVSWIRGTCYVDVIFQLSGPFWNQRGGPVGLMDCLTLSRQSRMRVW